MKPATLVTALATGTALVGAFAAPLLVSSFVLK